MDKRYTDYLTINEIQTERFNQIGPFEKRSCYDCAYLYSALSWWCGNKAAIKTHDTSIPGGIKCNFWQPDWNTIDNINYDSIVYKIKNKIKRITEKIRSIYYDV